MGIQYLGDGGPDGTVLFQSGEKGGFYGITTVTGQQAVVTTVDSTAITTVDSTAITTCDTTIATTGLTAEDTLDDIIEAQATAINRLIADSAAQAVAINLLITDGAANAVASNQLITKLRSLGLFASS